VSSAAKKRLCRGSQPATLAAKLDGHLPAQNLPSEKPCLREFAGVPRMNCLAQLLQPRLKLWSGVHSSGAVVNNLVLWRHIISHLTLNCAE